MPDLLNLTIYIEAKITFNGSDLYDVSSHTTIFLYYKNYSKIIFLSIIHPLALLQLDVSFALEVFERYAPFLSRFMIKSHSQIAALLHFPLLTN